MKQCNTDGRYNAQFREQAVQLLLQSDKTISQINSPINTTNLNLLSTFSGHVQNTLTQNYIVEMNFL